MTIIAWDGRTLAADRMMTTGAGGHCPITKIFRHKTVLLGIVGHLDIAQELREWYCDGAKKADFPPSARGGDGMLIVIKKNGQIWRYDAGPVSTQMEVTQMAWGSGSDYARAALYLGHPAAIAVDVSCSFQADCGLGIDELDLKPSRIHN